MPSAAQRRTMTLEQQRRTLRATEATISANHDLQHTARLEQHLDGVIAHSKERVRRNHISEAFEETISTRPRYRPRPT